MRADVGRRVGRRAPTACTDATGLRLSSTARKTTSASSSVRVRVIGPLVDRPGDRAHGAGVVAAAFVRSSSCRTRRRTLPTIVSGSASRNSICLGARYAVSPLRGVAAPRDDLLGGRGLALLQDDERLHAPRRSDRRARRSPRTSDLRVMVQHVLDLVRIHVEPGDEDHVLQPVDDAEVAVRRPSPRRRRSGTSRCGSSRARSPPAGSSSRASPAARGCRARRARRPRARGPGPRGRRSCSPCPARAARSSPRAARPSTGSRASSASTRSARIPRRAGAARDLARTARRPPSAAAPRPRCTP